MDTDRLSSSDLFHQNPKQRSLNSAQTTKGTQSVTTCAAPLRKLLTLPSRSSSLDEGQITHLICARLKYDLYDFFRGCFGPFLQEKEQEAGPKHPLQKSYRSYFRRAQIR